MSTAKTVLVLVLFKCALAQYLSSNTTLSLPNPSQNLTERHGKFIWKFVSLWGVGVVRFQNGVCSASDGLDGTCYTKRQCSDIGGIASGSCASNIGVCCVLQQTCGTSSSYNNTYFVNPAFPATMTTGGVCTFTIKKCSSNICQDDLICITAAIMLKLCNEWLTQLIRGTTAAHDGGNCGNGRVKKGPIGQRKSTIYGHTDFTFRIVCVTRGCVVLPAALDSSVRIDFLTLTLAQPNANGACVYDAMNILGGASTVPTICGENSGLHVYVGFNGDADIRIVIMTSTDTSVARSWKLKISQIACDCPTKAQIGCLMYYSALSGTVRSFNYGTTVSSYIIDNGQPGTRQLINTNYGICVEMQAGYCGIQWSQGSDSTSFTVSGNTGSAVADGTVGTAAASVSGPGCTTDFIVVPNPYVSGTPYGTDRFCGNGLPTLISYSKPFVLTTVTNGDDQLPDSANRGFALSYTQVRCPNIMAGRR